MEVVSFILLIVIGVLVGILASLLGVGGGVLYVPILILGFKVDALTATAVSSFVIIFTSLSGTIEYAKQKRIDFKAGIILVLLAIPGSLIGARIVTYYSMLRTYLRALFGLLLIILALRDYRRFYLKIKKMKGKGETISITTEDLQTTRGEKVEKTDAKGVKFVYNRDMKTGAVFGFIGGVLAGMLGIGGGIIFVPALNLIIGLPMHLSVATSTFIIIFSSIMAVIVKADYLSWTNIITYGIPLAIGAVLGAHLGARSARKIQSLYLKLAFSTLLLFTGIKLIL